MYEMGVFWLRVATALYGVGLLHVMALLLRRKSGFLKYALFAFLVGTVLHFVAIVELATAVGHLPVDNFFECATVCAFLIADRGAFEEIVDGKMANGGSELHNFFECATVCDQKCAN